MAKAKYTKTKAGYFRTKVWDGTYNADGSKHRIDVTSKKSSADLEKKVNKIKNHVSQNGFIASSTETVYDYALYWLDTYKSVNQEIHTCHIKELLNITFRTSTLLNYNPLQEYTYNNL